MTESADFSHQPRLKRRWLRFSLGSLFVLVTAVCVVLAVWVVRAERQKRAVAAIRAGGGFVSYTDSVEDTTEVPDAEPRGVGRWLGIDYVASPKVARLQDATPEVIDHASRLKDLTHLSFLGCDLTNDQLASFRGHTQLRYLILFGERVHDAGLASLCEMQHLEGLSLSFTPIGNDGLVHLRNLSQIFALDLVGTDVTDACVLHLRELPLLKTLNLDSTRITDKALTFMQSFTALKELSVRGSMVSDEGVARFRESRPDCRVSWP